jgi:predicted kinase
MVLILTRGYPGSGKTTYAQKWVAEDEANRRRVNRDDIRHMLFGRYADVDEMAVTKAQRALVETFLRQRKDVIIDDTNLKLRDLKQWVQVGHRHAHQAEIVDIETDYITAVERDLERGRRGERHVGLEVIQKFAKRYPMPWPKIDLPEVKEPDFRTYSYDPFRRLGPAIIVDLDGTLALHNGRSPYDYTKVSTDVLNETVDGVISLLSQGESFDYESTHSVIFLSGRPDSCREDTVAWIKANGWHPNSYKLFMRKAGDDRADYVVKYEIFDREIRDNYDVRLVLDDRDQVVDMWRGIGLQCWQVNRGDF